MKKNTAYTIGSLIILLICAFVFVALPAFTGSAGKQGKAPVFGKYNHKEIRYEQGSDMANLVSNYAQMYQNYGMQLDSTNYYYIFNNAFSSVVSRMAYTDYVEKSGYVVPTEAINRKLRTYFLDENGNFSQKLYKQANQKDVQASVRDLEIALKHQRFYDDVFGAMEDVVGSDALYGLKESDAELDFLTTLGSEKRGFNMAVFQLSDYPASEKINYGKANSDLFKKYDMSVITVEDKATAKTIAKRLASQEITFEDAVSEYSTKKYSSAEGTFNYSYQYQVEKLCDNKDDVAVLSALKADEISDVVVTQEAFSIFKANTPVTEPDFTDPELEKTIGSYLINFQNSVIEDYFTAKAKGFTSEVATTGFEAAGKKYGAVVETIEPFPLNFGSVDIASGLNTSIKGLSSADSNENFLKTAFSLKKDEISSPIVLNNNIVVLQYTTEEKSETEAAVSKLGDYDESAAQSALMASPKLENNFTSVYFKNFMNQ